ncbi:MAG TPA: porin family protein [Devosia sp.]|nr:porin family protein [Devosia sp.]
MNAADLLVVEEDQVFAPTSVYDWSGFYAGINAGYGGGTFAHPLVIEGFGEPISGSLDVTAGGFLGGGQVGFNHQFDNFVIGLEADLQGSTIDGRLSATLAGEVAGISADVGTRLDWFGTLRGRAGVAFERALVYGTAGLAYGHTTSSVNASGEVLAEPFSDGVDHNRWGYAVGAGIEYALTDNLTFKTEYLYTNLGSAEVFHFDAGELGSLTLDSAVAFHAVRGGLNYRF